MHRDVTRWERYTENFLGFLHLAYANILSAFYEMGSSGPISMM